MSNSRTEPSAELPATSLVNTVQHERESDFVENDLLRAALECMTDSVVITATDGRVLFANAAALHSRPASSTNADDAHASHGLFLADGVTPLSTENMPATRALAGESVRDAEVIRRSPGLGEQSFRVSSSLIRDASGSVQAVISVARENTRARAARQALILGLACTSNFDSSTMQKRRSASPPNLFFLRSLRPLRLGG